MHYLNLDQIIDSPELLSRMRSEKFWRSQIDGSCLDDIFNWDKLNELLFTHRITNDRLRMSIQDDFNGPNKEVFSTRRDGFGRPVDSLLMHKLHEILDSGATAVFEAINETSYKLNTITEHIFSNFSAQSTINAYISFGSKSGFGPHNDDHDVIVLQIHGRKQWTFFPDNNGSYGSVLNLNKPTNEHISQQLILNRGDILFIPKGVWHDVSAISEPSLHLTISLVYPSIYEYLKWAIDSDSNSVPFYSIRPFSYESQNIVETSKNFLEGKLHTGSVEKFPSHYYSNVRSKKVRSDIFKRYSFEDNDIVSAIPSIILNNTSIDPQCSVHISTLGRTHSLEVEEFNLLKHIQNNDICTYKELKTMMDIQVLNINLTNLLKRGLITKINDHE